MNSKDEIINRQQFEDKIVEQSKTIESLNNRIKILENNIMHLKQDIKDRDELLEKKIDGKFVIIDKGSLDVLIYIFESCVPLMTNYERIRDAIHVIDVMKEVFDKREKRIIL